MICNDVFGVFVLKIDKWCERDVVYVAIDVDFRAGSDMVVGSSAPFYILRPETAESLFILNQLTGDPIYRDWSWEIFQSIEKHCKTDVGYGALRDVRQAHSGVDDRMESFFLAETLKYLYLAQVGYLCTVCTNVMY